MIVPEFPDFEWSHELPQLYWNVKSMEQRILSICEWLQKLTEYSENLADTVNGSDSIFAKINAEIEALEAEFEHFKASGFDDYYKEQVAIWIKNNLEYVYRYMTARVFFGLTDDGYFVAYIPETWRDITFDTILDYDNANYGHLVLEY